MIYYLVDFYLIISSSCFEYNAILGIEKEKRKNTEKNRANQLKCKKKSTVGKIIFPHSFPLSW